MSFGTIVTIFLKQYDEIDCFRLGFRQGYYKSGVYVDINNDIWQFVSQTHAFSEKKLGAHNR